MGDFNFHCMDEYIDSIQEELFTIGGIVGDEIDILLDKYKDDISSAFSVRISAEVIAGHILGISQWNFS